MNLACVQCGASIALTATFCSACGRAVDADKDGVPDALGKMIEDKARGILASEREAEAAEKRRNAEEQELKRVIEREGTVEQSLRENLTVPRSWPALFLHMLKWTTMAVAIIWLPLGFIPHFIFGAIGYSPAGLVCPLQCADCSAPGRAFSWGYKGPWHSEKGRMGYALVCTNPSIDVATIKDSDVRGTLNVPLQPYMMHGFIVYFAEGVIVAATFGLLFALGRTSKKQVSIERERQALEAELASLKEQRVRLGGAPATEGSYRGI